MSDTVAIIVWMNGEKEIFTAEDLDLEQHEQPGARPLQAQDARGSSTRVSNVI